MHCNIYVHAVPNTVQLESNWYVWKPKAFILLIWSIFILTTKEMVSQLYNEVLLVRQKEDRY